MQVKSNVGDVVSGWDGLGGGVNRPVVVQFSQVALKFSAHFGPKTDEVQIDQRANKSHRTGSLQHTQHFSPEAIVSHRCCSIEATLM